MGLLARVGVRGEAYACWYLRRHGYVFIAKNCEPARKKRDLDLVGFDGDTPAFVEVRTRARGHRQQAWKTAGQKDARNPRARCRRVRH